jgi:hypothetical protein
MIPNLISRENAVSCQGPNGDNTKLVEASFSGNFQESSVARMPYRVVPTPISSSKGFKGISVRYAKLL